MWYCPGEHENGSEDRLAPDFFLVENEREKDSDCHVEKEVDNSPDHGLIKDHIEIGLGRLHKNFPVLLQAHDFPVADMHQAHIGQRQDNIVEKRIDHDADEDDKSRRHQKKDVGVMLPVLHFLTSVNAIEWL